jgi:hypothetical protein
MLKVLPGATLAMVATARMVGSGHTSVVKDATLGAGQKPEMTAGREGVSLAAS